MDTMRGFKDENGNSWVGSVEERPGVDYKGRFCFRMTAADGGEAVSLDDVRWNSERTARRTLETMSEVELQRRLRLALGRG